MPARGLAAGEPPPSQAPQEEEAAATAMERLIARATSSTSPELDPGLLRAIKSAARSSDSAIRLAASALLSLMRKPHSQVRLMVLLIADELFTRSKLFRALLVADLDQFLMLAVGFRRDAPLPPPSSVAATLRKKAIEVLEKWNDLFGVHYRQLRLAVEYLKNTLRLQFPNRSAATARREREARTQEILMNKFEHLKDNFTSIKKEIRSMMDEIGECLEIVSIKQEYNNYDNGDDEEEIGSLEMRRIRMDSLKAAERVHETGENKAVFDALREVHRLLVSKHLVAVQEWISVLIRIDLADNRFRDSALKELIDVRNEIQAVRDRCGELGIVLDDGRGKKAAAEEEEEDFWEEGKIEVYDPSRIESNVEVASTSTSASNGKSVESSDGGNVLDDNGSKRSDPERTKLLAKAPVMTWGPFLDSWGSSRDALVNQRGLELEGHWGRVDYDAVIPAEKIAELSVHRMVYKEEPVEIRPCLAPLKKGGLCQRRDLRVCPFHGPIIPRDADGNPIEQNEASECEPMKEPSSSITTDATNECGDSNRSVDRGKQTIEQLAKQAIKNVRDRDRDEKALRKAKHAKVREHNNEVLRVAALTSTSYSESFDQPSEAPVRGRRHSKAKEPTLASMLKKKVTAKDRITHRLLNVRARDAAIRELSQGEDLKYREAFPNQW